MDWAVTRDNCLLIGTCQFCSELHCLRTGSPASWAAIWSQMMSASSCSSAALRAGGGGEAALGSWSGASGDGCDGSRAAGVVGSSWSDLGRAMLVTLGAAFGASARHHTATVSHCQHHPFCQFFPFRMAEGPTCGGRGSLLHRVWGGLLEFLCVPIQRLRAGLGRAGDSCCCRLWSRLGAALAVPHSCLRLGCWSSRTRKLGDGRLAEHWQLAPRGAWLLLRQASGRCSSWHWVAVRSSCSFRCGGVEVQRPLFPAFGFLLLCLRSCGLSRLHLGDLCLLLLRRLDWFCWQGCCYPGWLRLCYLSWWRLWCSTAAPVLLCTASCCCGSCFLWGGSGWGLTLLPLGRRSGVLCLRCRWCRAGFLRHAIPDEALQLWHGSSPGMTC